MPSFPKPRFAFSYDLATEIGHLRDHRETRKIPARSQDRILAATWNVANLGAQKRDNDALALIAEIISWFDVVALQECRENWADLAHIMEQGLPAATRFVMSDASGNNERMVYIYDSRKLTPLEEIGEIAFPPARFRSIALPGISRPFAGFDRTPYIATFRAARTSVCFVNVHLYFGRQGTAAEQKDSMDRRALETYAVAKWAESRNRSKFSTTRELIAMGDFNMPKSMPGDPIFDALTRLGLEIPDHSSQIASTIASDSSYDQVAFLPGTTRNCFTGEKGVFDFDKVLFPELWAGGTREKDFKAYMRYYVSDHRPMWVQLSL